MSKIRTGKKKKFGDGIDLGRVRRISWLLGSVRVHA